MFYESPESAAPLLEHYLAAVAPGREAVRRYYAAALIAEVHALRGDLVQAERLARESLETARAQGLEEHPPTEQAHAALGAVLLARDELDGAEEQFERSAALSRRGGDRLEQAHALVWLARVRARQADFAGAHAALDMARGLAPGLGETCLRSLVECLEAELTAGPSEAPVLGATEALTQAELRVLQLFPTDLSYREIAQQLYVSLNTLRTHARRVRRKLGVTTRVDAVARAREFGLL
jgi:LuxR family maltose regulon positive regulatory protein